MSCSIKFPVDPHYCDLPDGRTRRILNLVVILIDGQPLVIPRGFLTDGASVPRFLWPILPPFGPYNKASLLHDYLYKTGKINRAPVTRKQADDLFLAGMEALQVNPATRWAMWTGVRVGAFPAWFKYRKAEAMGVEP